MDQVVQQIIREEVIYDNRPDPFNTATLVYIFGRKVTEYDDTKALVARVKDGFVCQGTRRRFRELACTGTV